MNPPIPDQPELFCTGCQRWKPRAQIIAARWVPRGPDRQAQYRCQVCQDEIVRRCQKGVRRGR